MALKQADQIRYDSLSALIRTLKNLDHDYNTILGAAAPQIKDFEEATGQAVRIKSNFEIELIDRRKDFLRIRSPNTESKVLRAKVDGVGIDVKLFKKDDYEFDNSVVASSLRRLADEVSGISEPLVDFPDCEIKEHLRTLSGEIKEQSVDSSLEEHADESPEDSEPSAHPDQHTSESFKSEEAAFESPAGGSNFQFEESNALLDDDDDHKETDDLYN